MAIEHLTIELRVLTGRKVSVQITIRGSPEVTEFLQANEGTRDLLHVSSGWWVVLVDMVYGGLDCYSQSYVRAPGMGNVTLQCGQDVTFLTLRGERT